MKIAVVGATGMVGREMLKVLAEGGVTPTMLIPVASARSVGHEVEFQGRSWKVVSMETALEMKPDFALFSAGGGTSLEWAPKFAECGTTVIDNSSAWRMDPKVPLVVPEINATALKASHRIIANPNCSTIQLVMALAPLHKEYGIKRVIVSTYQSVTGTGKAAMEQLNSERAGIHSEKVYPQEIDLNCLPHCDIFLDNDYTKEEMKMVNETRKILGDESIALTATAVRVPVMGGHSESVNIEFNRSFDVAEVKDLLSREPGVEVMDEPSRMIYPTPRHAAGKNEVFVGRIRRDETIEHGLNMWVVADNLRKGAATNAVQILKYLIHEHANVQQGATGA